jgi:hypothetical protein
MTAKEIVKRERITIREIRTRLIGVIEEETGKAIQRLDEWEMRIEKENLSTPITVEAPAAIPAADDEPIAVEIIAPSLAAGAGADTGKNGGQS